MRKVIKLVTFFMVFALLAAPAAKVMAGSINEYEAELIAIGEGVFEYNGVEYVATDAAKARVYNYLMQNDINLSASQAAEAKETFWGNLATGISDGYLVPLNPPANSGNSSGGGSSAEGSTDGSSSGGSDTSTVEPEEIYTYTELITTMYAKQAVNVRTLPSTSGERIGTLSEEQEVKVLGQCIETGWYRILYNGVVAYVSNNYLIDNKVEAETETELETEAVTETESLETEQITEATGELETEVTTDAEVTTESEAGTTEADTESETEVEEVVLREKHFNKGLNMTTVAIITGGIALAAAVIIVMSHKNRRY